MAPQSRRRKPKKTPKPAGRQHRSGASPEAAAAARYTPPLPAVRFRPTSHKVLGWALVALGIVLGVVNDFIRFGGPNLLPGGHSELYLFLAVGVAAYGGWWLGIFDRPA